MFVVVTMKLKMLMETMTMFPWDCRNVGKGSSTLMISTPTHFSPTSGKFLNWKIPAKNVLKWAIFSPPLTFTNTTFFFHSYKWCRRRAHFNSIKPPVLKNHKLKRWYKWVVRVEAEDGKVEKARRNVGDKVGKGGRGGRGRWYQLPLPPGRDPSIYGRPQLDFLRITRIRKSYGIVFLHQIIWMHTWDGNLLSFLLSLSK